MVNMLLRDFKPGDRVNLLVDKDNYLLASDRSASDYSIPAYIIGPRYDNVVVGWLDGDTIPLAKTVSITKDSSYKPYVAWFEATPMRYTTGLYIFDAPCRQCSKKCSTQDTKCWWCQVSFPTDLKRKGP